MRKIAFFIVCLFVSGCASMITLPTCICETKNQKKVPNSTLFKIATSHAQEIICKPLTLVDIAFVPNENILSVNAGDTIRWLFQTVVSHTDFEPITHLLIKPTEDNLETNAVITSSRRTYHLNLRSKVDAYQPYNINYYEGAQPQHMTLDTHYRLKNKSGWFRKWPEWTPTKIVNDGRFVTIYMLTKFSNMKAPALYVLDDNNKPTVINYEVTGNEYHVDQLFEKALLLKGRQKVLIEHMGSKK